MISLCKNETLSPYESGSKFACGSEAHFWKVCARLLFAALLVCSQTLQHPLNLFDSCFAWSTALHTYSTAQKQRCACSNVRILVSVIVLSGLLPPLLHTIVLNMSQQFQTDLENVTKLIDFDFLVQNWEIFTATLISHVNTKKKQEKGSKYTGTF